MGVMGQSCRQPQMSDDERAQAAEDRRTLARAVREARERRADERGWDDLERALRAKWAHGEHRGQDSYQAIAERAKTKTRVEAPPVRYTVSVKRAAAMSEKRRPPRAEDFAPLVPDLDPAQQAAAEEAAKDPPGAVRLRKPAGWRFSDETFWQKGPLLKCQFCGKQTDKGALPEVRHSPLCPLRRKPVLGAVAAVAATPPPVALPPLSGPVLTSSSERLRIGRQVIEAAERGPPEKSPAYLEWVRRGPCINCEAPPRSTASHAPSGAPVQRRGISQKVRDTLCTSKCWDCHQVYTGGPNRPGGCLPDMEASAEEGKIVLRSKVDTEALVRCAQKVRLLRAYDRLPLEWAVEAMSAGLARVPEDVLRRALLGEPGPAEAEQRLIECLGETAAEEAGA